jgi:prepilin-type N-terminal cleavage/methylation domain-containing protein
MKKNNRGLSLTEITVVLIIIGILAVISVPVFANIDRGKAIPALSKMRMIKDDIIMCLTEGGQCDQWGHWVEADGIKHWVGISSPEPVDGHFDYTYILVGDEYTIVANLKDRPADKLVLTTSGCDGFGVFQGGC